MSNFPKLIYTFKEIQLALGGGGLETDKLILEFQQNYKDLE